jgi:hypothetical protein
MAGHKRMGRCLVLAGACLLWTGAASAPAPGGAGGTLAEIVRNLGSAEFAVRERAQAELAKLPREQLEALREAEKQAKDAEVKARLGARISEIELDAVLHPPKLSVDLTDAPLAELAAALNEQMGAEYVQVDKSVAGVPPRVTLKAQDQPLWEILRQLMVRAPVTFALSSTRTASGTINTIKLVPARGPRPVHVTDGVMTALGGLGDPATGEWSIFFLICTDPRVRLMSYMSVPQVDKAIAQDGRAMVAMLPLAPGVDRTAGRKISVGIPDSVIRCDARFAPELGVTAIKELRGSLAVEVAESEHFVNIDLTKELKPLVTPWGTITVEKAANNDLTVNLEPVARTNAPADPTTGSNAAANLALRVLDDLGNEVIAPRRTMTTTTRLSLKPPFGWDARPPAVLEIGIPWNTREVRLPVVVKDLAVPPPQEWFIEPILNEPVWDSVFRR